MLACIEHVLPCKANVFVDRSWHRPPKKGVETCCVQDSSLNFSTVYFTSCEHGNEITVFTKSTVSSVSSICWMYKLDFPRATQRSHFRGALPRQHVLSLCPATVDHGMCNMGQSYSLFCGELWLSLSWLYRDTGQNSLEAKHECVGLDRL